MRRQFVFKLSPLPPDGLSCYFVYPGQEGIETFFADRDQAALARIREAYPEDELCSDGSLTDLPFDAGLASAEITPDYSATMAIMAYEIAFPGQFRAIRRLDALDRFLIACHAFWRQAPWKNTPAAPILDVVFKGALSDRLEALLMGGGGDPPGFAMFPADGALETIDALYRGGVVDGGAAMTTLGVTFEVEPFFAVDCIRRAYGFERLPTPMKVVNGEKDDINENDLLALSLALSATVELFNKAAPAVARVELEGVASEARVAPRAP
jgi:hypothetical protein